MSAMGGKALHDGPAASAAIFQACVSCQDEPAHVAEGRFISMAKGVDRSGFENSIRAVERETLTQDIDPLQSRSGALIQVN